jgi:hypothetical protein
MGRIRTRLTAAAFSLACCVGSGVQTRGGEAEVETPHFAVISNVASPSSTAIGGHLEATWQRFRELFGVEPAPVRVVLTSVASGASPARADQGGSPSRVMAWTVTEGEDLQGQGFSDLSHEIAHLYFLDLMGNPQGLHQPHAWLHEAVACWHESPRFLASREAWIRDRLQERTPLAQLFEMRNPVKENPLVELTVELHGKLARGEIDVVEMNRQIAAWAGSHSQQLLEAGLRNMTWYAQSLSVLEFLLEREGATFVRQMAKRLREGARMEDLLAERPGDPGGLASFEEQWVHWVETRPVPASGASPP